MARDTTFSIMLPHLGKAIAAKPSESVQISGEGNGCRVRLRSLPPQCSPHQLLAVESPDGSFRVGPDRGCTDSIEAETTDCLQVLDTDISDIESSSGRSLSGENLTETENTWGFVRGTVNEALMIRGCITPAVYIQYADLEELKRTEAKAVLI